MEDWGFKDLNHICLIYKILFLRIIYANSINQVNKKKFCLIYLYIKKNINFFFLRL
jgi:hypothetical protein